MLFNKYGKVGIGVFGVRKVVQTVNSFNACKFIAVSLGNLFALFSCLVDVLELKQSECSLQFVHFGVDAWCNNGGLSPETKIFKVIDVSLHLFVVTNDGSSLEGVEDFGGMKAEYAEVAKVEYRLSVDFYAKCVGGI